MIATIEGAFTRHSFWARHSKILARGPIVLGTARLIYTTKYRPIYTTFILGTALLNFGTWANSFGHGPLDLHDKIWSSFFNVDFWNGTPQTRTALKWQRFTCDFKRASGMSGTLSLAVQKKKQEKHCRFSSAKSNCMACCFEKWKRLSQLWDETRSSLEPGYSGLYNTRRNQLNVR